VAAWCFPSKTHRSHVSGGEHFWQRGLVVAHVGADVAALVDLVDTFRRAATYVDRILRGAKPEELPVQLPTKFELVLNLKTAKALGLAVPPSILLRATQMIE
jgi:putative ABC transport system substrate-binding protein